MALNQPIIEILPNNIYSIQNPKVIDNQIDKIEVQVGNGNIVYDYDVNLYNNTFNNLELSNAPSSPDNSDISLNYISRNEDRTYTYASYCSYSNYKKAKFNITLQKNIGNSKVSRFFYGLDDDGESEIKYTIYGKHYIGNADSIFSVTDTPILTNIKVTPNSINYQEKTLKNEGDYIIPKKEYAESFDGILSPSTCMFYDSGTVNGKVSVLEENEKYISLEFNIVCGVTISRLSGRNPRIVGDTNFPMYGDYDEYVPEAIAITIYGNTINLDLQNETLTIGNGKHVYSFVGNELIQSTNNPTVKENYKKIIDSWKNGKEVATLRCSIDDYYSYVQDNIRINILEIEPLPREGKTRVKISSNDSIYVGMILELVNKEIITVNKIISNNTYDCSGSPYGEFQLGEQNAKPEKNTILSKSGILPMTFKIGNFVLPYVAYRNGRKKPMSYNIDGTPKIFQVKGVKPIYDGAIWQELSIREYNEVEETTQTDETNTTNIEILGENSSGGGIVYIAIEYVSGKVLKEGNIISYQGQTAEVTGDNELRCEQEDIFTQSIGKIITVEIVK